jgi:hypothetical protein
MWPNRFEGPFVPFQAMSLLQIAVFLMLSVTSPVVRTVTTSKNGLDSWCSSFISCYGCALGKTKSNLARNFDFLRAGDECARMTAANVHREYRFGASSVGAGTPVDTSRLRAEDAFIRECEQRLDS